MADLDLIDPPPALPADVLSPEALRCVYQPLVDLDSGAKVGHEALLRGPRGSAYESPVALLDGARAGGQLAELERLSLRHSLAAASAWHSPTTLFVNVEPSTLSQSPETVLDALARRGPGVQVVVEITERALAADPAGMLALAERLRAAGCAIALDDVGAVPESLAFIPVLQPEVVKLDLGLLRSVEDMRTIAVAGAVRAYAESTGAEVVAEGIETTADLTRALVLGATLGQGWYWGRPGAALHETHHEASRFEPNPVAQRLRATPFELRATGALRRAPKHLLLPLSMTVEQTARQARVPPLLLACFQDARHFTPATARRYAQLAAELPLVSALGRDMPPTPVPGVRGVGLAASDPLADEWTVVMLGAHDAVALVARDRGDGGADRDREFDFQVTYDRARVTAAAQAIIGRIPPA
ncbi:EAL domain-containing protein [Actinotalea sp. BY-33]|uniref:EAL domain-containing protein n=1 Tax=Actinotalea soli TaxID=2819234 RepID=A0A939LNB6_9CELL|nr:EAL domain-containing protein [Actinotalea soli]MBO1750378.1 EAL domain-containing protein [Actinotalea soli]